MIYDGPDLETVAAHWGCEVGRGRGPSPGRRARLRVLRLRPGLRLPVGPRGSPSLGSRPRGRGSRPGRWRWPAPGAASIRRPRPAVGRSSAPPTRCCGTPGAPSRRCSHRARGSGSWPGEPPRPRDRTVGPGAGPRPARLGAPRRTAVGRPRRCRRRVSPTGSSATRRRPPASRCSSAASSCATERGVWVAVTGAPLRGPGRRAAARVRAGRVGSREGGTLRLGRPSSGLRTYVAVAGGIAVEPVLGSRSTDTLGHGGPAAGRGRRRPARG